MTISDLLSPNNPTTYSHSRPDQFSAFAIMILSIFAWSVTHLLNFW